MILLKSVNHIQILQKKLERKNKGLRDKTRRSDEHFIIREKGKQWM